MRIAYVTTYDAHNPRNWSGLGFHIAKALEGAGCELDYIGPLRERCSAYFRAKTLLYRKFKRQAFQRDREPAILDGYARQVEQRLRSSDAKIVFSPGTVPIAHLQTNLPVVFWADATYAALQQSYQWELPAAAISLKRGHAMEQRAIDRVSLAIYSSDWAARSAINDYHAAPGKVKVVPFGANIDESRTAQKVQSLIASRPRDICKLLFVGVGWERKGGDVAIDAARFLNEMGLPCELTIIGSLPPNYDSLPSFIKPLGFIDKSTPAGREQFENIFASSHFLILPARAEAFGVVLCEANSFGLPCLATNVGGIPTIVRDSINGQLFPPEDAKSIAAFVKQLFGNFDAYARLAESSFEEYQARLNWRIAGQAVRALLESL
ncbi:MAG TPA: glycosyltransferase family 4 protein [Tepidisphaeraceae bacterium]|jgi:glycosyltransferase involved in cell wall biosynthesis|nr:glycosyltransferase family 4 protein [Tepidisphaeraceae bacterium]